MSLSQIIMYHNEGFELKYGTQKSGPKSAKDMSYEELKAKRDELRELYGDIDNG